MFNELIMSNKVRGDVLSVLAKGLTYGQDVNRGGKDVLNLCLVFMIHCAPQAAIQPLDLQRSLAD